MATKTERILSYLPATFLAMPGASALRAVAAAFGGELQAGENSLAALMRAHWVDHADRGAREIDDLRRFAVLWGLAPRDDEEVEEFREHLKRYVRNQLRGTVTVAGILRVAAEALGLRLTLDEPGNAGGTSEPLDAWWTRRDPVLTDLGPRGEVRRRRFVSRAFVAGEAARTLLGFERGTAAGTAARPARLPGKADLSRGVDLSAKRKIRLAVDGAAAVEIDCAGQRPRATTLAEVADAINARFPELAATLDGRRLTLTSPTAGAASRLAFDFVPPEEDARELLFGAPAPVVVTGAAAQPAVLTGDARHGGAIDLSRRSLLKIAIDGGAPVEIDVADASPASMLLPDVAAAIEAILPGVASVAGDKLRLTSPTAGPESRVEVLPLRTLEVEEFPTEPAEARAMLTVGGRFTIENRGAAEVPFDLELLAPQGAWAPGVANLAEGWIVRALAALAPGEAVRFTRDSTDGIAAVIVSPAGGTVRALPPEQLFVGALAPGPGAVTRAFLLPRGASELTLLEGSAARFDAAAFDHDAFAGPPLVVEGRFDLVRFAPPRPERDPAAPAFAPLAATAPIEAVARWSEHRPGTFVVRLPLDLPPRFGGRFDQARFGASEPERIEGVVLDAGDPLDVIDKLAPGAAASRLVTATRIGRAPIGFTAVTVPFRKPRFLRGGGPERASRLHLAEAGVPGVIEITAAENGAWGDEVAVAVRPAGPARWDLEIHYRGARFENARQAVLGRPLPPLAREPLPPGPNGVLAGKAAGIAVRVERDGADDLPSSLPAHS